MKDELIGILQDVSAGVRGMQKKIDRHEEVLQKILAAPDRKIPIFGTDESKGGARFFGEALQHIYRCALGDSSAGDWLDRHGISRAMQEDTDSEGGYLVPTEHYSEILRIPDRGVVEPLCRRVRMNSKTTNVPDLTTSPDVYWVGEESSITESDPVIGQKTLTAVKEAGMLTLSNELLQDSRPEISQWLGELFSECMMLEADNQILQGSGDPCSGVLTAAAGYSVVLGSGSTSFADVSWSDLSKAISKLSPTVLDRAIFVMSPDILHYIRTLKDANNRPIWSPDGLGPGTIYGYRVIESSKMPGESDDGAGTAFIVFGNFSGFLIGDRMRLSVLVNPYSLQATFQTRIRWLRRIALTVGQPNKFVRIMTAAS